MASSFNFDDVVLAEGDLLDRKDREWSLLIACGAASSVRHGTSTQKLPIGREAPMDAKAGIRTSDDLLALAEVVDELRVQIAERLNKILPPPSDE